MIAAHAGARSIPLVFAADAVIASLADTLMPEPYGSGVPTVAFTTANRVSVSYLLAAV